MAGAEAPAAVEEHDAERRPYLATVRPSIGGRARTVVRVWADSPEQAREAFDNVYGRGRVCELHAEERARQAG